MVRTWTIRADMLSRLDIEGAQCLQTGFGQLLNHPAYGIAASLIHNNYRECGRHI